MQIIDPGPRTTQAASPPAGAPSTASAAKTPRPAGARRGRRRWRRWAGGPSDPSRRATASRRYGAPSSPLSPPPHNERGLSGREGRRAFLPSLCCSVSPLAASPCFIDMLHFAGPGRAGPGWLWMFPDRSHWRRRRQQQQQQQQQQQRAGRAGCGEAVQGGCGEGGGAPGLGEEDHGTAAFGLDGCGDGPASGYDAAPAPTAVQGVQWGVRGQLLRGQEI